MLKNGITIVDINTKTAPKAWDLLVRALDKADYVSLDLELSGLGKTSARHVDERYEELCEVVRTRSILSVGVATFTQHHQDSSPQTYQRNGQERQGSEVTYSEEQMLEAAHSGEQGSEVTHAKEQVSEVVCHTLEVQVFNVWLLCDRPYTIDPSSAKFLVAHGFDFNKQFSLGLSYTPPEARNKMYQPPKYGLDKLLGKILERKVPVVLHNGLLDLLHLYYACLGPLPHALPTLLADIADLFVGGVYDTKAIAQFKFYEDATFLEYLFRKSQRWSRIWLDGMSGAWSDEAECRLNLCSPMYTPSDGISVELEDVAPPPLLPRDQLLQVQICSTYALESQAFGLNLSYGYCHAFKCNKSHNVTVAIDQKACLDRAQKSHRRRKRPRACEEISEESHDDHMTTGQESKASLVVAFEMDIAAARERLNQDPLTTPSTVTTPSTLDRVATPSSQDRVTTPSSQNTDFAQDIEPTPSAQDMEVVPSASVPVTMLVSKSIFGSHRSGVDAFMTGFTFTCYALQSQKDGCHGNARGGVKVDLSGLANIRNCLASRRRSQHHLPLTIFKSQYARNSSMFTKNRERLITMATELQLCNGCP